MNTIGWQHPVTLITQNNIANCLQKKGNYDEALVKYIEVEKLGKEILGDKHRDTLIIKNDIACCLEDKGNYDEA